MSGVSTLGVRIGARSDTLGLGRRSALATVAACPLLYAACGEPLRPASTGDIRVSVSLTGADVPATYSVLVGGRLVSESPSRAVVVGGFAPHEYSVMLRVARNCQVDGDNPRTVKVSAGDTTGVTFSATCVATTGTLRVTTVTTGVDLDRDGYTIRVDGYAADGTRYQERWPLDANGTKTVPGVPIGEDAVTLIGMSVNCDPLDVTRRTVSLAPSQTVDVTFTVACAPDRGQLAFVDGVAPGIRHIYIINANGTSPRRLTDATSSNDEDPAWSPDGKKIAFTTDRDGNREIYVVGADGANALRLTSDPDADYQPAWSPDGSSIAFVSERLGAPGIFLMNADGTNQRRLTTTSARDTDPAWSRDGRIAFTSAPDGNVGDVYAMNADGTGLRRLTDGGGAEPAWSPDGTTLAYTALFCRSYDCYRSIFIGSATVVSGATEFGPGQRASWSPDGRKIAFTSLNCDFYYIQCTPSSVRIVRLGTADLITLTSGSNAAWRPP